MIYALLAFNVVLVLLLLATVAGCLSVLSRERSRAHAREDTLLTRIQAPQVVIAQEQAEANDGAVPYIGAFDDEAAAQYEEERRKLERSTRELVASIEGAA